MRTSLKHMRIKRAATVLKAGGIIAYPTEAMFGLGCDPFDPGAVHKLLQVKRRAAYKGLILIAAEWEHVKSLVDKIPNERLSEVMATWPGPYTWVFPATERVPPWIKGENDTVAVRVTKHPIAYSLCKTFNGPIVSTSANIAGGAPLLTANEVKAKFLAEIDFILPGRIGELDKATQIRDARTGLILR